MPEQYFRNRGFYFYGLIILAVIIFVPLSSANAQKHIVRPAVKPSMEAFATGSYGGVHMEASLGRTMAAGSIYGAKLTDSGAIKAFYARRKNHSFWLQDNGLTGKAHALLDVLQNSWTHGLNPEKYHLQKIERLIRNSFMNKSSKLELLLTDAAIRYARDLSGMRINPAAIKQREEFWKQPEKASAILSRLRSSDDIVKTLESFAPQDRLYTSLRRDLIKLAKSPERDFSRVLPLDFGKKYFFPRERSQAVSDLRFRLGLEKSDSNLYDDSLAKEVMEFQRKNDLEPDGIIGPKTLDILNQSNHKKMLQIIANLERLRWLDRELPRQYILVNTASQMLWAVENGRVIEEMKVINGKPWRRTKEFKAKITGIRFNPDWTIPPGIKRYDIWPKVKKDPGYLHEKGIEIIRGRGDDAVKLDPHAIDWHNISLRELHDLRFVGVPGETNPLGYVRVLMPNRYNMYLHDTNHPELFDKPERTYSSGCIRMERPYDIARFVLKYNQDWDKSRMEEILESGEKTEIDADSSIPVYVIHQTAWLDARGKVVYSADIYKRDKELIEVLEDIEGFMIPEDKHTITASAAKNLAYNSLIP